MLSPATRQAYAGVAQWLAARQRAGLRVLGINGAQGSGKSTLAAFLVDELSARHGVRAVALSLDDFYLGRQARVALARTVHPLLATRGVPGTHDAARGLDCLRRLRDGAPCAVPRFSKAEDDVLDPAQDRQVPAGCEMVLLEGWCVGTPPQDPPELIEPVNALERDEDADGRWRGYANQQLAGPYARWFAACDALLFLQVPGWESVRAWRAQQEQDTAAAHGGVSAYGEPAALERFLQHYERLTRHALAVLPQRADRVLRLDTAHDAGFA